MAQYIDKNTIIAEIEKREKIVEKRLYINNSYSEEGNTALERDKVLYDAYNSLLHFLDKLEMKEADLENFDKNVTKIWSRCAAKPNDSIACLHIETFIEVARHFYQLGLEEVTGKDC